MGHLLWTVQFMSQRGMETENDKGNENNKLDHAPWLLETLRSYCRILDYLVNYSFLLVVPCTSQLLVQLVVGGSFTFPRGLDVFVHTLQAHVLYVVRPIWNDPMFFHCSPSLITSMVSIISNNGNHYHVTCSYYSILLLLRIFQH